MWSGERKILRGESAEVILGGKPRQHACYRYFKRIERQVVKNAAEERDKNSRTSLRPGFTEVTDQPLQGNSDRMTEAETT